MNLTTEALRSALKAVAPAVLVNAQNPLLAGVKITAGEDGLTFAASDYQTWIETRAECDLEVASSEWTIIISHRLATSIASAIRAKSVTLEPDNDGAVLRFAAGRSFWLAPRMLGEVPQIPALPPVLATLEATAFAGMVAKVSPAASVNPTAQPALHVIELAAPKKGAGLSLAATDRYRVHAVDGEGKAEGKITIYPEAAGLAKVAGTMSGTVAIHAETDGNLLALADGTTTVLTRVIGVEKWLPIKGNLAGWQTKIEARTTVHAPELLDAIKGASAALPDDSIGIWLSVTGDGFTVSATDDDSGAKASADIEDFNHDGPGITASARPGLLTPPLALAGDGAVEFAWVRPYGPFLITIPGQTGTYVVMGLRVPGAGWNDNLAEAGQ